MPSLSAKSGCEETIDAKDVRIAEKRGICTARGEGYPSKVLTNIFHEGYINGDKAGLGEFLDSHDPVLVFPDVHKLPI